MKFLIPIFILFVLVIPMLVSAEQVVIENPLGDKNIGDIIGSVIGIIRDLALGVGIIMVLISGMTIMTAGGSEEKVTKGKKMLLWTVIGVAIIVSVEFITGFILELLDYDIGI